MDCGPLGGCLDREARLGQIIQQDPEGQGTRKKLKLDEDWTNNTSLSPPWPVKAEVRVWARVVFGPQVHDLLSRSSAAVRMSGAFCLLVYCICGYNIYIIMLYI